VYNLLYLWLEGSLFAISVVLTFCALTAYGGALLTTTILPRWTGWATLIYACVCLGLIMFVGRTLIPPELAYVPLGFLGVLLLLRRSQPATGRHRPDVPTGETADSL
jgi:hypothetical protein